MDKQLLVMVNRKSKKIKYPLIKIHKLNQTLRAVVDDLDVSNSLEITFGEHTGQP